MTRRLMLAPWGAVLVGGLLAVAQHGCASARFPARVQASLRATGEAPRYCPMVAGLTEAPRGAVERGGGMQGMHIPIMAYLVKAHGLLFLVDAGMVPWGVRSSLSRVSDAVLPFMDHPGLQVTRQLQQAGLSPSDLAFILLTHAHGDHAGELENLPGVPIIMAPEEAGWLETIPQLRAETSSWRSPEAWQALASRVRVFRWDGAPAAPPQQRRFSLFSDGSVELLHTPGHTPGSISVVLRGERLTTVLLGDATFTVAHARQGVARIWPASLLDDDPTLASQTAQHLMAFLSDKAEWELRAAHDESQLRERYRFPECAASLVRGWPRTM